MSNFKKNLIKGLKSRFKSNLVDDEEILNSLINSNLCPHQLGLDGGFNPEHCTGDCYVCWNDAYKLNN